jgi:hypothetical protein
MVGARVVEQAGRHARSDDMRRGKGEKGQALIELALSLTLLVTIAVGLADFAYVFRQYVQVVNAANNGAVYAAKGDAYYQNIGAIRTAVLAEARDTKCLDGGPPVVSLLTGTGDKDSTGAHLVTVHVECTVNGLIPIAGIGGNISLSANATKRVQP